MKRIWIPAVIMIAIAGGVGFTRFSSVAKAAAMPVVLEDIQYPFEKGGGLVHVAVEDVFMGVGMIVGERLKGSLQTPMTGSVNFELMSKKARARLQVDRIRLVERTPAGEDGRVFEPVHVRDEAMEKGLEPELQFLKGKGAFPFVWENGESDCVFFTFQDIPQDLAEADLVITYNGMFPGKKHRAYYEDRLSVKRKSYPRSF